MIAKLFIGLALVVSGGLLRAQDYDLSAPWGLDFGFGYFGMADAQDVNEIISPLETFDRNAMIEQSSGQVVHAHLAMSGSTFSMERYDQNGNRDAGFAAAAHNHFSLPSIFTSIRLAQDSVGRLYVGLGQSNAVVVCSLSVDGVLREDFRGTKFTRNAGLPAGCIIVTSDSAVFGTGKASFQLQVDPNDRLVVAGQASDSSMFIVRMDSTGAPDSAFGNSGNGKVDISHALFSGESGTREMAFADISIAQDSSLYLTARRVSSDFQFLTHIFKVTPQGGSDAGFAQAGELSLIFCHDRITAYRGETCISSWALGDVSAYKTAIDGNGYLLVAAQLNSPFFCPKGFDPTDLNNICPNEGLFRVSRNGQLDGSFGLNGLSDINRQLPPYIWVTTTTGVQRAQFASGIPFELLISVRKGEYAILATRAQTALIPRASAGRTIPGDAKDLILTVNSSGQLDVAATLVNFGSGAPTNCAITGAGPLLYTQGTDAAVYIYAEGAACYGSMINPMPFWLDQPVFFMSRIRYR